MKYFYLVLFFSCCGILNVSGQWYPIDKGVIETRPCEFDTIESIDAYSKIRMYSTLNDEWDGPVDSSLCYSLVQIGSNWSFPLSSVPSSRSVFFDMLLDAPLYLDTSTVYNLRPLFGNGSSDAMESVYVNIEMPDSSGNNTETTVLDLDFENSIEYVACFPTQKIISQRINGLVFELSVQNPVADYYLTTPSVEIVWNGVAIIPQLTTPYPISDANLLRYWHDIYPSQDSISYTDVLPAGAPIDSVLIQYVVGPWSSLHFQNYTAMRGNLVSGSNTQRHGLEVVLQGNMCVTGVVEVSWEGGNQLVVDGGTVGLNGARSCNVFGSGGGLRIKSGSDFQYGHNGIGMLALRTGAQLVIEPGAELTIHGPVIMNEYATDEEPQQIYTELSIGAKLTFGEGSSITNRNSRDGTMKLNIYMRGGEVDVSGLSEEEQQLINLIYDSPSQTMEENLTVYPNPTSRELQFMWVAEIADRNLNYEVFDISGRVVLSKPVTTENTGHNRFSMDVGFLRSGIYTLRLMADEEVLARRKFVKE